MHTSRVQRFWSDLTWWYTNNLHWVWLFWCQLKDNILTPPQRASQVNWWTLAQLFDNSRHWFTLTYFNFLTSVNADGPISIQPKGQTDRQTDRQTEHCLNSPVYSHLGTGMGWRTPSRPSDGPLGRQWVGSRVSSKVLNHLALTGCHYVCVGLNTTCSVGESRTSVIITYRDTWVHQSHVAHMGLFGVH